MSIQTFLRILEADTNQIHYGFYSGIYKLSNLLLY